MVDLTRYEVVYSDDSQMAIRVEREPATMPPELRLALVRRCAENYLTTNACNTILSGPDTEFMLKLSKKQSGLFGRIIPLRFC